MTTRTEWTAAPPALEDVRAGLRRVLGEEYQQAWQQVCASASIAPDQEQLADQDFDRLLSRLGEHSPLCRVLAMSWRIRRTASRKLTEIGR